MKRLALVAACLGAGVLAGAFASSKGLIPRVDNLLDLDSQARTPQPADEDGHGRAGHDDDKPKGKTQDEHGGGEKQSAKIAMAPQQIDDAKIAVKAAAPGVLSESLRLPGTIVPDRNRVGRVPAKVVGTVVELRKGLGDRVDAGETIAILDSREVADAKSEYIAALVNFRLQDTLYQREKTLWEKKVSAEQRLLRAEATFQEARVRRDLARQKLSALGVDAETISKLSDAGQTATKLERYEIKAPIGGRIVEHLVDVGTPMGGEGQAHELYAIADLSRVWVELTVSTQDLQLIKEGQRLAISGGGTDKSSPGKIIFTSPLLNTETRSARVIAAIDNADGAWRPGSFVTAVVAVAESKADVVIPKTALHTIEGEARAFVRTADGFEARAVATGRDDGGMVEVISGLAAGELVASNNSFLLKAELGKSEAEHAH